MIDPKSPVKSITIEGSKQSKLDGECVIDLAEYAEKTDETAKIAYFQLKHSTLRLHKNLTFSDAQKTLAGFAARFQAARKEKRGKRPFSTFTLVTNRLISPQLKMGIERIRTGKKTTPALQKQMEKSTKLAGEELPLIGHSGTAREALFQELRTKTKSQMATIRATTPPFKSRETRCLKR